MGDQRASEEVRLCILVGQSGAAVAPRRRGVPLAPPLLLSMSSPRFEVAELKSPGCAGDDDRMVGFRLGAIWRKRRAGSLMRFVSGSRSRQPERGDFRRLRRWSKVFRFRLRLFGLETGRRFGLARSCFGFAVSGRLARVRCACSCGVPHLPRPRSTTRGLLQAWRCFWGSRRGSSCRCCACADQLVATRDALAHMAACPCRL